MNPSESKRELCPHEQTNRRQWHIRAITTNDPFDTDDEGILFIVCLNGTPMTSFSTKEAAERWIEFKESLARRSAGGTAMTSPKCALCGMDRATWEDEFWAEGWVGPCCEEPGEEEACAACGNRWSECDCWDQEELER
jgi:hypothetical protein